MDPNMKGPAGYPSQESGTYTAKKAGEMMRKGKPRNKMLYGVLIAGSLIALGYYNRSQSEADKVAASQNPEHVKQWQKQTERATGYAHAPASAKWTVSQPDDTRSSLGSKSMHM